MDTHPTASATLQRSRSGWARGCWSDLPPPTKGRRSSPHSPEPSDLPAPALHAVQSRVSGRAVRWPSGSQGEACILDLQGFSQGSPETRCTLSAGSEPTVHRCAHHRTTGATALLCRARAKDGGARPATSIRGKPENETL